MNNKPKYKTVYFRAALSTYEYQEGILFKKNKTALNKGAVNIEEFANTLQSVIEELDGDGYDIAHIIPIQTGHVEPVLNNKRNWVGEVGLSITQGATVVGVLRK